VSSEKRGQIPFTAAELLAAVERSPALVAVHDRAGWCALYAADGQINDPVGSRPHQGREAIERFYDTFIAPNQIRFNVDHDRVCGMSVMRDLTIRTTMSTGVALSVPMHLRYDLVEEAGALKIRRLYAHWELPVMVLQLLKAGLLGLWTAIKLGPQLIRNQGIGGVLGFMRGFFGHGRAGKRAAIAFLEAAGRVDATAMARLLAPGARLELPFGTAVELPALASALRDVQWRKVIGAGDYVTATVQFGTQRGVALFGFERDPRKISSVQVFV
jgi:hypothetical protein